MLSLLSWVVTGVIVGLVARPVVPARHHMRSRQHMRTVSMIALGVVGACLGGLTSAAIWPTWAEWTNNPDASRRWPGWLMAFAGAAAVLCGYVAATGRRGVSYPRR